MKNTKIRKERQKYTDKENEKYRDKNIKTYDILDYVSSVTKDVSTVELIFPSTLVISTSIKNAFDSLWFFYPIRTGLFDHI